MTKQSLDKQKLDSIEQSFLALDSLNTSQVISVLCLLDRPIDQKLLHARLLELAPNFPRLMSLLRPPHWVSLPNFNLEDNLISINSPKNLSFKEICSQQISQPLNPDAPLWKILIINGNSHAHFTSAAHFIFHHSLSDGMGIMEFIKALCDDAVFKKNTDSQIKFLGNKLPKNNDIRKEAFKLVAKDFFKSACHSPINGLNSSIRRFDFLNLPLVEINEARKHYQVSLHEYMLGLVCMAIGRYCSEKNFPLPCLSVLTPVSHRHPKSSFAFGNYLTGMTVEIALNEQSPQLLLYEIKNKLRSNLDRRKDEVYIYLANAIAKLPKKLRKALCNFSATRTNLICTSAPSSGRKELRLLGSKITHKYGTATLMKGHGLSFAFIRYLDCMSISIVSDPNIVNDPELILQYLSEAHSEFRNSLPTQKEISNA